MSPPSRRPLSRRQFLAGTIAAALLVLGERNGTEGRPCDPPGRLHLPHRVEMPPVLQNPAGTDGFSQSHVFRPRGGSGLPGRRGGLSA